MMFTIEPGDHWRAGDRAYCLRGEKRQGRYLLEAGRVYRVADVQRFANILNDGLWLDGVDGARFWSGRFVCLRGKPPYTRQIAERTRRSWYEAYRTSSDARQAAPTTHGGEKANG